MTMKIIAVTIDGEDVASGSRLLLSAIGSMVRPIPGPKAEEEALPALPPPSHPTRSQR